MKGAVKVEVVDVVNYIKGIRMKRKRARDEICAFNTEKRNNGNIQRMCVELEVLPKGSAA